MIRKQEERGVSDFGRLRHALQRVKPAHDLMKIGIIPGHWRHRASWQECIDANVFMTVLRRKHLGNADEASLCSGVGPHAGQTNRVSDE